MDIQRVSTDQASSELLEEVSTSVLAKSLEDAEREAQAVLESLPPLPEDSGATIDLLA
jgi:hypothetical protein